MRIARLMAPTGVFNSHLIMANCVERHGTDSQKEKFLPRFATGELRGGIGLTEPDAGTDLQGIRTTAIRQKNTLLMALKLGLLMESKVRA